MEDYKEEMEYEHEKTPLWAGANRLLIAAAVALLIIAGVAFGYGYRQQIMVGHLTAQQSVANATIGDLQGQLSTLSGKLNDMAAAQQAAAAAEKAKQTGAKARGARSTAKQSSPADKRYKQLQAQLEEQQKQLKETQDLVAKNRSDLETNLSSTKDELNGSIARTHEELVALQKRGERNYFEFDLSKSKQFQRVGPLTLSLRKADTKHKSFELQMIVDDNRLTKKNVNLYEPIWIHTENEAQPVQIVVNRINKNLVHGYVSAPKYRPSELAAAGGASVTPVSQKTPVDPTRPNPQQPDQQPNQQQPQVQPQTPQPQPEL
jgi:hypothetical protein